MPSYSQLSELDLLLNLDLDLLTLLRRMDVIDVQKKVSRMTNGRH